MPPAPPMPTPPPPPPCAEVPAGLRLRIDGAALIANWRLAERLGGVPAIPVVKANAYGLGAVAAARRLAAAGAAQFAVANWREALELGHALGADTTALLVLHGFTADEAPAARRLPRACPVLSTPMQCAAWGAAFPGRAAHLMLDLGMNRLGLGPHELAAADGLSIAMIHGHLACAEDPHDPRNAAQQSRFVALAARWPGVPRALAGSCALARGPDFALDATRPGLMLHGCAPVALVPGQRRVARIEARTIRVHAIPAGDAVGYGGTWVARRPSRIATVHIGYADGLLNSLGPALAAMAQGRTLRPAGRISMDMAAFDATGTDLAEGDWVEIRLDDAAPLSAYERLTVLGARLARVWDQPMESR